MRHLAARRKQTSRDDVRLILAALFQALFERFERRRQDENLDRVMKLLLHLLRALPVDFEQHVMAAFHLLLDPHARGAVVVPVHFRAFEKLAGIMTLHEIVDGGEVIVLAVLLLWTRRARRGRDRQTDRSVAGEQRIHERRLAGARRRDDHEQVAGICAGIRVARRAAVACVMIGHVVMLPPYSRFCTCSRICSMSSLSVIDESASSFAAAFEPSVFASRFSSCIMKSSRLP